MIIVWERWGYLVHSLLRCHYDASDEHNKTKINLGNIQDSFHAPQGHWDNSHLIMFINGTEDDLCSILGNLELGVSD